MMYCCTDVDGNNISGRITAWWYCVSACKLAFRLILHFDNKSLTYNYVREQNIATFTKKDNTSEMCSITFRIFIID